MQRLQSFYLKEVVPRLKQEFDFKNLNQVPKIEKVIINRGFDESCQNLKILDVLTEELCMISGQKPLITKSKKAIASFKIKENMSVGMFVTLRGEKMYSFLDRLINLALPRIRDFQGITKKGFDGSGNFTFGLSEQLMFPEINYDKVVKSKGMEITIVTNTKSDDQSYFLLKFLNMPFR